MEDAYANLTDAEYLLLMGNPNDVGKMLGMTGFTVRKWIRDNRIPRCRRKYVAEKMADNGVHFDWAVFILAGEMQ